MVNDRRRGTIAIRGIHGYPQSVPVSPVGFEFSGHVIDGMSRNGGGSWEFILPSGVVLNTFEPLLDNPLGRLVLLNLLIVGGLSLGWYFLRDRVRNLRSGLMLRAWPAVEPLASPLPSSVSAGWRNQANRVAVARAGVLPVAGPSAAGE